MIDIVLITIGGILIVAGIIGCVLPVLPGPPISYTGLLLLQFSAKHPFTVRFLIVYGILTALVAVLDYIIPIYGTKIFQGSKYGIWGSVLGLIIGLIFFPPFGIIIGPVAGAFIREMLSGKKTFNALKAASGTLLGFLAGTAIKLILTIIMAYHFVMNVL